MIFSDLRPAAPAPMQHHLTIVQPDPRVRSAMPIVTTDSSADYKLLISGPSDTRADTFEK
jgi:hypothetical protein